MTNVAKIRVSRMKVMMLLVLLILMTEMKYLDVDVVDDYVKVEVEVDVRVVDDAHVENAVADLL